MSSYFIIIIVVLICLSAFFSASETAYSSVNRIRLKNYAGNGNKRAEKALKITDNFDKTLSTILIGNNIVNIASASLGTVLFTELFGASGVGLSTFVMTVVVLIFGEILPKSVAKEKAETIALAVATPLSVLIAILTPLSFLFMGIKKGFMKLFKNDKKNVSVTEEELKDVYKRQTTTKLDCQPFFTVNYTSFRIRSSNVSRFTITLDFSPLTITTGSPGVRL